MSRRLVLSSVTTFVAVLAPLAPAQDAGPADEPAPAAEEPERLVEVPASAEEALGMVRGWLDDLRTWVEDEGGAALMRAALFLVILLVSRIIAGLCAGLTARALAASRLQVSALLEEFARGTVRKIVMLVGIIVALDVLGVPVAPLVAGLGVVGFVVGFALQDTLGNFAAGIMILLYRPYDVGHYVEAGGTAGSVVDMTLVSTTFKTPDNKRVIVPNGAIWGGTITNYTANPTRRVDMTMSIGYGDDIDEASRVIEEVVTAHPKVLEDPAPQVEVAELGDSSVDFVVRPWVDNADYWAVKFDLTRQLKQRFDEAGLSIPFPQRDVHVFQEG